MEEEYLSRIEGHADVLAEYMECYEEYAASTEERTAAITNTQRIYEKLRSYWRKELRRMEDLQNELDRQGKTVKEADARRLLRQYVGIDNRMRYIFGLTIISHEVLMQYSSNFSSRRIDRERQTILSMHDTYIDSRDRTVRDFNRMAKRIKAPLIRTVPQALREQTDPEVDLRHILLGARYAGLLGAGVGVVGLAIRVGEGVGDVNSRRQDRYRKEIAKVANYIDDATNAYARELDNLDFRFNRANAFLIGPDGLCLLEVTDTSTASSDNLRDGDGDKEPAS